MADNKQYINQTQDGGKIMIYEDVISTIASRAIVDVEGVVSLSAKPVADIAELIGRKNWSKGLKVTITPDNDVTIDCSSVVAYGQNILNVGDAVKQAVYSAVESMAGVKPIAVNVNICQIVRQ